MSRYGSLRGTTLHQGRVECVIRAAEQMCPSKSEATRPSCHSRGMQAEASVKPSAHACNNAPVSSVGNSHVKEFLPVHALPLNIKG